MLAVPNISDASGGMVIESRAAATGLVIPALVNSIITLGYYGPGDGGGSPYERVVGPETDTSAFQDAGGAWWANTSEVVNPRQFGVKGIGLSFDDTTFFQSFRDFVASTLRGGTFDTINICYSVSPNFAIEHACFTSVGKTEFTYTGTEDALVFNADAADAVCAIPGLCYDVTFCYENPVHVNCPPTAKNAVYRRSIHHSRLGFNVHGAGTTYAGQRVDFGVVNKVNYICSVNEDGWYLGAKPAYGIWNGIRNAGEFVSYETYINPIVEGPGIGYQSTGSLGCVWVGGTFEACTAIGVFLSAGASGDRFVGCDLEANGFNDFYILGTGIELIGVDSDGLTSLGTTSKNCRVIGGRYQSILNDIGALGNSFSDVIYGRSAGAGTFTEAGTATSLWNVRKDDDSKTLYLSKSYAEAGSSILVGTTYSIATTLTGVKVTDSLLWSCSVSLDTCAVTAVITSAGNVKLNITNTTAGTFILPACTITFKALRQ